MIPGRGVSALIEGKMILAGNMEMMTENRISFNQDITEKAEGFLAQGCTVIYVAFDGILAGFLALLIQCMKVPLIIRLHSLNVEPVLLTGDHENAAASTDLYRLYCGRDDNFCSRLKWKLKSGTESPYKSCRWVDE